MKSLDIDHARDGEVMIAYAMNGEQLPLLNGFPLRLVVPGWYSTYWVKMLNDIEVLDEPDDNFWMKTAYPIPDTPRANIKPGQTGVKMVPINRMVPRSFVTNLDGRRHAQGRRADARCAASPSAAIDRRRSGRDSRSTAARAGSRRRSAATRASTASANGRPSSRCAGGGRRDASMVRCTNSDGVVQPVTPNWNPSGFMRNVIETTARDGRPEDA